MHIKKIISLLLLLPSLVMAQAYIGQNAYIGENLPFFGVGYPNQFAVITSAGTRNDITGCLGFSFTVGSSNLVVGTLGRLCMGATTTSSHVVYIVSSSAIVASGTVDMTGISLGNYAKVAISPVTLTAGTTYVLCTDENTDLWYDTTPVTLSGATAGAAKFLFSAPPTTSGAFSTGTAGNTYSGPNLWFQ